MTAVRAFYTSYIQALGRFQAYTTDGTVAGTGLLPRVLTNSYGGLDLAVAGSEVFLTEVGTSASSFSSTITILVSDGSAAGMVPFTVAGIPTSELGAPITTVDGRAIFTISSDGTTQLWSTDGTPAGTVPILPPARTSRPSSRSAAAWRSSSRRRAGWHPRRWMRARTRRPSW